MIVLRLRSAGVLLRTLTWPAVPSVGDHVRIGSDLYLVTRRTWLTDPSDGVVELEVAVVAA